MKLAATCFAPLLSLSVVSAAPAIATARPLAARVWAEHPGMMAQASGAGRPAAMSSKDDRAAAAASKYEQNRPVEAALGFEGLWKDYPDAPDFLFNAATSRFAAGHFAHTIAHTDQYLAVKTLGESERKAAETQRRAAVLQTGVVAVTVQLGASPQGAAVVELVAQFVSSDSSDIRSELVFKAKPDGTGTLHLDPGFWTVRAQAAGYQSAERQVEVHKGQTATVGLDLAPALQVTPPDGPIERPQHPREVPPVVVRRSKIGFGVVGGVSAAAGVGVIISGSIQARNARDCTKDYQSCAIDLSHGVTNRGVGVLVLGTGLGLIVGILPWMAKGAGARKKAWIAQTVIGGASAVAGLIVLGATRPAFIDALVAGETTDNGLKDVKASSHVAGNLMLGLGLGTAISAITNLIVQHHHLRKVEMSASVARGQFGLMFSGRF
ncbi:MAG: hypothetical protein H0T76_16570 [Nannocystis sp.]|nr:hypothetical protein [Nannocystis sp.]MBA3548097.1 hypothetical protein [Nannocystis sp.]